MTIVDSQKNMKKNMVKFLISMGHEIVDMPSVHIFGANSAEIRICCDVLLKFMEIQLKIKIKVHVYVQACGADSEKKKKEHGNKTGGEYFAEIVRTKVIEDVKKLVDVKQLNDECQRSATQGLDSARKSCNICMKSCEEKDSIICICCM